jgi:hypothetical protein
MISKSLALFPTLPAVTQCLSNLYKDTFLVAVHNLKLVSAEESKDAEACSLRTEKLQPLYGFVINSTVLLSVLLAKGSVLN